MLPPGATPVCAYLRSDPGPGPRPLGRPHRHCLLPGPGGMLSTARSPTSPPRTPTRTSGITLRSGQPLTRAGWSPGPGYSPDGTETPGSGAGERFPGPWPAGRHLCWTVKPSFPSTATATALSAPRSRRSPARWAGGELIRRAQDGFRRVTAFVPDQVVGRGRAENRARRRNASGPQSVVVLYRAQTRQHRSRGPQATMCSLLPRIISGSRRQDADGAPVVRSADGARRASEVAHEVVAADGGAGRSSKPLFTVVPVTLPSSMAGYNLLRKRSRLGRWDGRPGSR